MAEELSVDTIDLQEILFMELAKHAPAKDMFIDISHTLTVNSPLNRFAIKYSIPMNTKLTQNGHDWKKKEKFSFNTATNFGFVERYLRKNPINIGLFFENHGAISGHRKP